MPATAPPSPESSPPRAIELLAPAGDRACLVSALEAGADEVFDFAKDYLETHLEG